MSKSLYEVRESAIHGKGLFATRLISDGDVIGTISYNPVEEDGPYVLWIDGDIGILVECELKYINHNKHPNACYCDDLQVVAIRDIQQGEEITHDYGDDWV